MRQRWECPRTTGRSSSPSPRTPRQPPSKPRTNRLPLKGTERRNSRPCRVRRPRARQARRPRVPKPPDREPPPVPRPPPAGRPSPGQAPDAAPGGHGVSPLPGTEGPGGSAPAPDAPPAQLAEEYGLGLQALKGKCTAAGVLSAVLLLFALLDSGVLPVLDSLLPANILLLGSLALFAGCVLLSLDVLKEGLVQLTNLAPNGDTLALFAALFTLVDGVTMVFTPLRESAIPFFSPCALVLTFHLLGRYCDRSAKFQACRVAASVSQPYLVTQDPNVLGGRTAFRKWLGVPKGFGSQIRTTSQAEARFRRLTPVLLVACFCLSLVTTVAHHQPNLIFWSLSALFTAAATLGVSLALNLPLRMLGEAGQAGGGPGGLARPAGRQGVQGRPAAGPGHLSPRHRGPGGFPGIRQPVHGADRGLHRLGHPGLWLGAHLSV
ncbi:MAG: hypothetical protein ACLT9P_00255 [Evtepia gabavorous]